MVVHSERFEDAGEQDEQGLYDYSYCGTLFTFRDAQSGFLVRQYADEPSEAHFLSELTGNHRTMFSFHTMMSYFARLLFTSSRAWARPMSARLQVTVTCL